MMAVDFKGSNKVFNKPDDMNDEQCISGAPGYQGFPCTVMMFMPSKEDLDALGAGRPLIFQVLTHSFVPMKLYTLDENNQPNS